jgi:hypothetical protein
MASSGEVLAKLSALIKEANQITIEIRRLNNSIKEFRERKKQIEAQILQYMGDNQIPALQYNDSTVILAETKIKKKQKRREERIHDSLEILRLNGIEEPDKVLSELNEARFGPDENIRVMKVRNNLQL